MAPHSSTLAWKIPWMEEPGRLQSMGLLRVGHNWATSLSLFTFLHWRRKWQPIPVFLPWESQGWGSPVDCHLWGCTESDMTERLPFHFSLSHIGEGNGNPFQCSCLENPRDGGAWWAAVYGVAQSRTRLKRLSSSSSSVCMPLPQFIPPAPHPSPLVTVSLFSMSMSLYVFCKQVHLYHILNSTYKRHHVVFLV